MFLRSVELRYSSSVRSAVVVIVATIFQLFDYNDGGDADEEATAVV